MDINAVIAEATSQVANEAKPSETNPADSPATEAPKQEEQTDLADPNPIGKKPDSELTAEQLAKREANRQAHLNSKLARMRRENRELRQTVEKIVLQAKAPQTPASRENLNNAPKEADFDNYSDYLEARTDWKIEQKLAERENRASESAKTQVITAQKIERIKEIEAAEQEFAKATPEYAALYNEYSDFMGNLPLPVAEALMETENPTLALFALMKEGKLESLEDMTPNKISMEIGKAELRGQSYLSQQNKATNAPTPIQAARGTGVPGKSLADKSVEELMKQFNSR